MDLSKLTRRELMGMVEKANTIQIIYPNVNTLSQRNELKYSLRSLEKNLVDTPYEVWIVGERPDWISNKVKVIEVETSGKSPREDVAIKRLAVCKHPEINETFYWMNDDIYFINPVTVEDLGIPTVINNLEDHLYKYDKQIPWGNDMHKSFNLLSNLGYHVLHYATHLPHKHEKKKTLDLIKRFDLTNNSHVFELLYYTIYANGKLPYWLDKADRNNLLVSVNRPFPDWDMLDRLLLNKKFLNNSEAGMTDRFEELLQQLFPDKSCFEQ